MEPNCSFLIPAVSAAACPEISTCWQRAKVPQASSAMNALLHASHLSFHSPRCHPRRHQIPPIHARASKLSRSLLPTCDTHTPKISSDATLTLTPFENEQQKQALTYFRNVQRFSRYALERPMFGEMLFFQMEPRFRSIRVNATTLAA